MANKKRKFRLRHPLNMTVTLREGRAAARAVFAKPEYKDFMLSITIGEFHSSHCFTLYFLKKIHKFLSDRVHEMYVLLQQRPIQTKCGREAKFIEFLLYN